MSILLKIWIFELDFSTVLSFIIGLFLGMVLLSLIYALLIIISIKDKKYTVKVDPNNLRQEEAIAMVKKAQDSFRDNELRGRLSKSQYFKRLANDLVYGIAASFYPDSKYPMLEITIDEAIELMGYVQYRLDAILNKKALKLLKKFKISTIVSISLTSQSVMETKSFQVAKSATVKASKVKKVIDTVNPLKWFKRIFVDNAIRIATNKIYLVTLGIIGEEAYKIYSKSVLKHEETIDTNVDEIVDSINDDLREIVDDYERESRRFKTKSYEVIGPKLAYQSSYDINYNFMSRIVVEENNEKE